jgi:predicted RecB family nuclease
LPITYREKEQLKSIRDYNEDNCRATRVLLDGIGAMTSAPGVAAYS